jgi:hypothetical protein
MPFSAMNMRTMRGFGPTESYSFMRFSLPLFYEFAFFERLLNRRPELLSIRAKPFSKKTFSAPKSWTKRGGIPAMPLFGPGPSGQEHVPADERPSGNFGQNRSG